MSAVSASKSHRRVVLKARRENSRLGQVARRGNGGNRRVVPIIVLILLLLLLGGGGFLAGGLHILWLLFVIGLILWVLGFFIRAAEGGGRWYYW